MYEFAILALGGLVVAKSVDILRGLRSFNATAVTFVSMVVGVAYAFGFDFSLFAAWDVGVREAWMGTVATGLFMGGMAGAWHHTLGVMREWAHRSHGEASEIEARLHRAA